MPSTPSIENLTARDILQTAVASVKPDDTMNVAERLMVEQRLTGLPVVDGGRLVGVISRSDVTRVHVLAESLDGQIAEELHWDETQADGFKHGEGERFLGFKPRLEKLRVKDVMRSQVVTCRPDAPIRDVAALLVRHHIHRVFIVEQNKPLGVINSLDLVALLAKA
jgi:CBS domain-containing protein